MEIQLWRKLLSPYELAVRELVLKFEHIILEHQEQGLYSPIEQVSGRVKSVSSILDKIQRKHIPMERLEEEVEDEADQLAVEMMRAGGGTVDFTA